MATADAKPSSFTDTPTAARTDGADVAARKQFRLAAQTTAINKLTLTLRWANSGGKYMGDIAEATVSRQRGGGGGGGVGGRRARRGLGAAGWVPRVGVAGCRDGRVVGMLAESTRGQ